MALFIKNYHALQYLRDFISIVLHNIFNYNGKPHYLKSVILIKNKTKRRYLQLKIFLSKSC